MTTESVATPARPADLDTTLRGPRTGHLSAAELTAYFDTLAEAVQRIDPGPSAPGGWENRERLRFSTWVRAAYEHPLSPAVFVHADAGMARSAQHRQAAELGLRMDVSGTGIRPARPTPHVRAAAAVAAVWSVTALAVTQSPRPPRERVVSDAWRIAQEIIAPALLTAGPGFTRARARGAW
ncbi:MULTISPECIES: hypothetical protein [Streptomyces]|uniref:hypothetical protein n=1 Tax=Streptomyces TaxID=1883 RepID=UPI000CF270B9|nr:MULTISPECIES: hypothetical protein [Streptomyces]